MDILGLVLIHNNNKLYCPERCDAVKSDVGCLASITQSLCKFCGCQGWKEVGLPCAFGDGWMGAPCETAP